MPILVIGSDRSWRLRMERAVAVRGELSWCGACDADAVAQARCPQGAVWLLDGDDPATGRLCRRLHARQPTRLHFHRNPDATLLRRTVQAGGSGCLDKLATPEVVLRAVRAVSSGLFAVESALLLQAFLDESIRVEFSAVADRLLVEDWPRLTDRQREIVHCVARGLSNKQIGRLLGISPETVKTHLHHVFSREGISGRMALAAQHRTGEMPALQALPPRPPGP
ncbi:response regulator transcription factor [Lysobacter sp. D1-1-M9]|uniref:helix-turn-helix transcriptional regulator n=1 Tax=Novilysobacter longmucuonensis TaxID=3098603 RepID=UPI002FCC3586